jgi:hypothetical protein
MSDPDCPNDRELLALTLVHVRRIDPMLDPSVQANAGLGTEAALRLLAPHLDRQVRTGHRPSRHRRVIRIAALAVVVAATVFVAANIAATTHDTPVSQAEAQTILRHVRDALKWPADAIYEEDDLTAVTSRNGRTYRSGYQEWLSTSSPFDSRMIISINGKVQWEQAFENSHSASSLDLYDPRTHTVYLAPAKARESVCTDAEASAGTCQTLDQPQWNSALSEVQYLLNRPDVKINPDARLGGKRAIELTFDHDRFSYWISADTYEPLQSEDRHDQLPDGQTGVGITQYKIARVLTGRAASPGLLSLQVQHPTATIDRNSTDYTSALDRFGIERPGINTSTTRSS